MKLMHGDILTNNREPNTFFFVLNPCLHPNGTSFKVVAQNMEDKSDFRYINSNFLDGNPWSRYTEPTKEN